MPPQSAHMPTESNDQNPLPELRFTPTPGMPTANNNNLLDTKLSREILDAACNIASSHDFDKEMQADFNLMDGWK